MTSEPWTPDVLAGDAIVVDDFYDTPDRARDLALAATYVDFGDAANFPGRESEKAYGTNLHAAKFAELLGKPIFYDPQRWVFGKFRVATGDDRLPTSVHLDFVDWTAVVYLSPNAPTSGGLTFYEHKPTGWQALPGDSDLHRAGFGDRQQFDREHVMPRSLDEETWRPFFSIDALYNRCIIFRGGRRFHGITQLFGHAADDGRLTQNFFFMDDADTAPSSHPQEAPR